jgi:hypothetical protein
MFMLFTSADATEKTLVDEEAFVSERVAALNVPLFRTGGEPTAEEEVDIDQFPTVRNILRLLELWFTDLPFTSVNIISEFIYFDTLLM